MDAKSFILKQLQRGRSLKTSDVVKALGISRQTAAQHFRELVNAGRLIKIGSTRSARYVPFSKKYSAIARVRSRFAKQYKIRKLSEDRVFGEVAHKINVTRKLSGAAYKIAQYAFTEMLNNAIDHSKAVKVRVEAQLEGGIFAFVVSDRGIGAFESVRKKFKLKNAFEAAEHLLKGKQTTVPKYHSGQGIFFTSRIADHFVLESKEVKLDVNNLIQDVSLLDIKPVRGTKVVFSLRQKSRKNLKKLFDAYTDSDLVFDKTEVRIRLSKTSGEYISRSEARRLLFGLEKFKRIMMDFNGVRGVGQSFADEVFRVFARNHPQLRIEPCHMSPSVTFIINRARRESLQ